MSDLKSINTKLKSLGIISGFSNLSNNTSSIASSVQALNSSSLGGTLNESISGIQALNTTAKPLKSIAILTENITGLQSQVVKDVSGSKSDLDAITGTAVNNGFLDMVITSATAEGVKTSVNAVASPSDSQLNTILSNVVPEQYAGEIDNLVLKDYLTFSQDFSTSINTFTSNLNNLVSPVTGNLLQDLVLQTDNTPISIIENFGVPPSESNNILRLLQEDKFNEATKSVTTLTGRSVPEAEAMLNTVPVTLSSQISSKQIGTSSTGTYDVASKNNEWEGSNTLDNYFDIIATQEQLQIEMIKCPREITELMFFGHETTANQVLTAADIHNSYKENSGDGIPFHYVVLSNGNIQRGRSLAKEGSYSSTHSKYSIGIVIPHVIGAPATSKQDETVSKILETFYEVWPGGQVFDAELDTDDSEVKVGVPIESLLARFKKVNYGNTSRSFSTDQLISAAQGNI